MKPGETKRCQACSKPLIGALTRKGKVAPVNYDPEPEGNVLLFRKDGEVQCRTFAGETLEALREEGVPMRLNHFADCPHAAEFAPAKDAA